MTSKPVAKAKGRSPRRRRSSSGASQRTASQARASRKLLKSRIRALEARYSTLHSWVGELHEAVTGESIRAHPDDLEDALAAEVRMRESDEEE